MSSNIKVQRICQYCGIEFTARTTVTKTCSDFCAKRLYKKVQRNVKISDSNLETQRIKNKPVEDLKAKEFLTITEACSLLSLSRWTIWRVIKKGEMNAAKVGRRTLIRRSDIDKLFDLIKPVTEEQVLMKPEFEEFYSIPEVQNKYGISDHALYYLINRNSIPKTKRGRFVSVPKTLIDKLLSSNKNYSENGYQG
jgi:excisionase family DNA binding protein